MVDKKIVFTVLVSSVLGNVSTSFAMEMNAENPYENAAEFSSQARRTTPLEGSEGEFGGHTTCGIKPTRQSVQSGSKQSGYVYNENDFDNSDDEDLQSTSDAPAGSSISLAVPQNDDESGFVRNIDPTEYQNVKLKHCTDPSLDQKMTIYEDPKDLQPVSFCKRHAKKLIMGAAFAGGAAALVYYWATRPQDEEKDESNTEAMRQMTEDMTTSAFHSAWEAGRSLTQRIWDSTTTRSFWRCLESKFVSEHDGDGRYLNTDIQRGYYQWSLSRLAPLFSTERMQRGELQDLHAALHVDPGIASTINSSHYREAITQTSKNLTMLKQFLNRSDASYSSDTVGNLWSLVKAQLRSRGDLGVLNYVNHLCGRN